MSKAILILAIFLATLYANQVSCQPVSPSFRYALCRNTLFGNYTTNSTYEDNLKTVLSDLVANASSVSFYNTSAGSGNATVYGQYNCRGDVDSQFCSDCIQAAALLAQNCSNAKAGVIWFSECTLRYKNESMYGVSEISPILSSYSLFNMTDPAEFSAVLNDTVSGLIQEVAHGNGSSLQQRYFATDAVPVSTLVTAYFLAQCSPDLSEAQCESCLVSAFNKTQRCCGEWPLMIYSFPPSCQVMYDTRGPFFFTASTSTPPPPMSLTSEPPPPTDQVTVLTTPPPPSTSAPTTGGSTVVRSSESMKLGIASIALLLLMLVIRT